MKTARKLANKSEMSEGHLHGNGGLSEQRRAGNSGGGGGNRHVGTVGRMAGRRGRGEGALPRASCSSIRRNYGERGAIVSDINDIGGVIGRHLKAKQITEERETRATCAATRLSGLKRSPSRPIPDCFPTLSLTGSLNPVNGYSRYLRYRAHICRTRQRKNSLLIHFSSLPPSLSLSAVFR